MSSADLRIIDLDSSSIGEILKKACCNFVAVDAIDLLRIGEVFIVHRALHFQDGEAVLLESELALAAPDILDRNIANMDALVVTARDAAFPCGDTVVNCIGLLGFVQR